MRKLFIGLLIAAMLAAGCAPVPRMTDETRNDRELQECYDNGRANARADAHNGGTAALSFIIPFAGLILGVGATEDMPNYKAMRPLSDDCAAVFSEGYRRESKLQKRDTAIMAMVTGIFVWGVLAVAAGS